MSDLALTLARHPRFRVGVTSQFGRGLLWVPSEDGALVPDLTDPATAGVLLAMLMASDPTASASITIDPRERTRILVGDGRVSSGATLGEALARALLAVWGPA